MGAIESYQPSGRFHPLFLLLVPLLVVVGVGLAWLYQLLIHVLPFIYLSFVLTLALGFAIGCLVGKGAQAGKCRNLALASLVALATSLASVAAGHLFAFTRVKAAIAETVPAVARQEFQEEYGFREYLDDRTEIGWSIGRFGRDGGLSISGVFVHLIWLVEAVLVAAVAVLLTRVAVKRPFSENCDSWTRQMKTVEIRGPAPESVEALRTSKVVEDLWTRPAPGGPGTSSLLYTLSACPEDQKQAFLTVTLKETVQKAKGKTEDKLEELFTSVILDSRDIQGFLEFASRDRPAAPEGATGAPESQRSA